MYYAILCEDVENSLPLRQGARPAHLARLQELADQGRLLAAGPHPALDTTDPGEAGFTGSLIIGRSGKFYNRLVWARPDGSLAVVPSTSPENAYLHPKTGEPARLIASAWSSSTWRLYSDRPWPLSSASKRSMRSPGAKARKVPDSTSTSGSLSPERMKRLSVSP